MRRIGQSLMIACVLCGGAAAWAANPGDVIITEIMYNPNSPEDVASNAPLTEWVEIYNTTDQPIDLTGWYTADEDGRSGNFEAFTLPAHGIAVIIPTGYSSNMLTKAQFTAAWGTPASQLIQPTTTNDCSRGRPNACGTRGGIFGDGISNSPTREDNDNNDLDNTPFGATPCPYGAAYCNTAIPDNEVLLLVDSTNQVIDKVNIDDDTRGWPSDDPDGPSIVLDSTKLNATDNDIGANWSRSVVGQKRARNNAPVNWFTGLDTGSPGRIEGVSPAGNDAPIVAPQSVWTARNVPAPITLAAYDDNLPVPWTYNFVIETLPANGTLADVANGNHVITTGELPYTIATQYRAQLLYTQTGPCGNDSFTFHANDMSLDSNTATVTLLAQCGELIITEIMYDPASTETTAKVNEWVEVYNTTDSPLDVTNWYLTDKDGRSGNWPAATIPAHGVAVIVPPGRSSRIMDAVQYRAAWDGYNIQIIIPTLTNDAASGEIVKGGLANSPSSPGEDLRIVDASGRVQDRASYLNAWPWPLSNNLSSIFLQQGCYDALANDTGTNWQLSADCAGGAYASLISGFFDKNDFGSPGFLAGVTAPSGNTPPTAVSTRVGVLKNTTTLVTLPACDDGEPGGPMTFTIQSLAVLNGTLKDPGNGTVISAAPYTLVNNGNRVEYTPNTGYTSVFGSGPGGASAPNEDSFTYSVDDGEKASRQNGTVTLVVQKGGLVISEIMYRPANNARNDWQWYEVTNTTAGDINLYVLTDDNSEPDGNMFLNITIPGGATRVITSGDNGTRTAAAFLAEWTPLASADVIFHPATQWEKVANEGDRLQLIDDNWELLDEVYFSSARPWPVYDFKGSIYVVRGKIDAIENDKATSWRLSTAGTDGAYATPETTGDPLDSDVGSPGLLPRCFVPRQDADGDGDVDLGDFSGFQACFNGPNQPWSPSGDARLCACVDADGDGDVDLGDFSGFQACFNGPNRAAACR